MAFGAGLRMSYKLVSIILLTWNPKRFLKDCFESIISQSYLPFELIVVDNGSTDGSADALRPLLDSVSSKKNINWKLELLPANIGFAQGMNRGIAHASGDYILTLNQDVVMNPDYISRLVNEIESEGNRPKGSVAGKILNWRIDINSEDNTIDSAGHEIFTDRIVQARGKNEPAGIYGKSCAVFGVSASAALYNRKALSDVSIGSEIFDRDFFSYLEDVDLDYRLLFKGYESRYVPDAQAKHAGGGSGGRKSFSIRFKAHTNRYLVWLKNEEMSGLIRDFFPIALQELYQFIRTFLTSPLLFLSWFVFPSKAVRAIKKGRIIYADGKEYRRLKEFIRGGRIARKLKSA